MKEKVIRVFLTKEEADKTFSELIRKAFNRELEKPIVDETFVSIGELVRILTPCRMELLKKIHELKPNSIKELAEKTGRDFKNVYNDLKVLSAIGLVEFREEGRSRRPYLPYDKVKFVFAKESVGIEELSVSAKSA